MTDEEEVCEAGGMRNEQGREVSGRLGWMGNLCEFQMICK